MASSMLEPGIFRDPRPKKSLLPPPSKKRKTDHKIEEISFDNDARADYLTGFHKRKLARAKQAQLEAAKKAREDRVLMRKQLREERKQELEEHVQAINQALEEVNGVGARLESGDEDAWSGIEGKKDVEEVLDREEEYVDEDRYTNVTVEAVDVSKEGLRKVLEDEESDEAPDLVPAESKKEDLSKKKWPKKERKKKFRYESKAERKFTRGKQKAGNKAKADARKGNS